jgi:hypothetical protein
VTDGQERLAAILHDAAREKETIRVLEAEWSYLNQPDRLEKLARQHLKLEPMRGRQFASLESLADAPPEKAPEKTGEKTAVLENALSPAPALPEKTQIEKPKAEKPVIAAKPVPPVHILKPPASAPLAAALPRPSPAKPHVLKPPRATAKALPPSREFGDVMKSLGVN